MIRKIENIDHLVNLSILNLSSNYIQIISGLGGLNSLETIDLSNNKLENDESL